MTQQERLQLAETMTLGMSKLLGTDTEIVVHDLDTFSIHYIVNGYITGRTAQARTSHSVYDTILNMADADGHIIGYHSFSKGKDLRSSHFLLKDEDGTPRVLVCINQDTSKLLAAKELLERMTCFQPLVNVNNAESEKPVQDIKSIMQSLILNAIENVKPTPLDTKEGKMQILQQLEEQGVFDVKDAVPQVCKLLAISQATFYNYLREIRSSQTKNGWTDSTFTL